VKLKLKHLERARNCLVVMANSKAYRFDKIGDVQEVPDRDAYTLLDRWHTHLTEVKHDEIKDTKAPENKIIEGKTYKNKAIPSSGKVTL